MMTDTLDPPKLPMLQRLIANAVIRHIVGSAGGAGLLGFLLAHHVITLQQATQAGPIFTAVLMWIAAVGWSLYQKRDTAKKLADLPTPRSAIFSYLTQDLMYDEGLRLAAYRDTRGNWTIGYGHTGPEVKFGVVWSKSQCVKQLNADIVTVEKALGEKLPWYHFLDEMRADVLRNMGFNLGVEKLTTFSTFLELVKQGEYAKAALDMMGTDWAKQVGQRAFRLSQQMRSGQHSPRPEV